ncbi:hypothetical protein [Roseibium aggregatum]|uniref:hypothetical protein n=1 Tax=Roseibium aggregatum TaxID=187304 RepID=UPI001E478FD1|nr:hypothetical protein [Roseibium aggregatum]UES49212.1 hypothetical protein GFK88_06105 [Roseibium aggregatum]
MTESPSVPGAFKQVVQTHAWPPEMLVSGLMELDQVKIDLGINAEALSLDEIWLQLISSAIIAIIFHSKVFLYSKSKKVTSITDIP